VQSALAGFVVLVLAGGVKCVFNRLWQKTLLVTASDALNGAARLGLSVQPLGLGPIVVARGHVDGQPVRIEWRGGWKGETTHLRKDRKTHQIRLIRSREQLEIALFGEE